MPNRLAVENSPYLLQHADNPVDWHPWGAEARALAAAQDKPIFLSIGYAACHWCHVMAHESFEDTETAALMNREFINIKVDREERPDLDGIYMSAVVAMTGSGGWPMSVFLTPEGIPFYGGTYFPPMRRYNMPSFREVLHAIARLWREDRPALLQSAAQIDEHLKAQHTAGSATGHLQANSFDQAVETLLRTYDWQHGGWGQAPKFPQPMAIEVLLRAAVRGDERALAAARHVLESMARGGMYDILGGGFARYSTDNDWLVPHFEKMLYDNAQLAVVYLYGYMLTGKVEFRQVCEATLDFILRELSIRIEAGAEPQIGFFSSLDADSEGEEDKFYIWTQGEIEALLDNPNEAALFNAAYGVTAQGNFEGKTILRRCVDDNQLAERFGIPVQSVSAHLHSISRTLLSAREQRIRPATDDKALTAWNALALVAFAEAGRYLARPDYVAVARANARFLLHEMTADDSLRRSCGKDRQNTALTWMITPVWRWRC